MSTSEKRFIAKKHYREGDLICNMVKPKIIPILNKGRSKFSYGEDSWETIRQKHVFPPSYIIFDKRKAKTTVWFDVALINYTKRLSSTRNLPSWTSISKATIKKKANAEMTTQGIGLGPKWRALCDIEIGDEIVCSYTSEYFTRSINDDIVSSMIAKETLRKSQSSKTRDKTSISNEKYIVNNSSSTTKIAYKQSIDNDGRLYKNCNVSRTNQSDGGSTRVKNVELTSYLPPPTIQIDENDETMDDTSIESNLGIYNEDNKKHKKFGDFVDFFRRTFKCKHVDLKMFQVVRDGNKNVRTQEILVQNYDLITNIGGKTFSRNTPTSIARIVRHKGIKSYDYSNKINGWQVLNMYIPLLKDTSNANKNDASVELSNRSFCIGDIRLAAGLVKSIRDMTKTHKHRIKELKHYFKNGGCENDDSENMQSIRFKHVSKFLSKNEPINLKSPTTNSKMKKKCKTSVIVTAETVKRRPGRPKGAKNKRLILKRKNIASKSSQASLVKYEEDCPPEKKKSRKCLNYVIEAGFPPIPVELVDDSDVDDDNVGGDEHDIIKLEAEDENHDESQSSSQSCSIELEKHAKRGSLDNIKCDHCGNCIIHSISNQTSSLFSINDFNIANTMLDFS